MAPSSAASSNALKTINSILNTILNSRLQRKAKSVILTAAECIIVLFSIFQTYQQLNIENESVKFGVRMTIYVGAGYTAFVALFIFIHSIFFLKTENVQTSENVELAFAKTNMLPVVDGILEIPFALIFRGPLWYLSYLAWLVCGGVIGMSSYLFYVVREELSLEATSTLSAGALLLYQMTSDFSEYWVHSRNRESTPISGDNNNTPAGSVNDDDMEASKLVGERETSSAGFTRI